MPALFGYLIALTLLLGGGYAGLEWLASPDVPAAPRHLKAAASATNQHADANKSAAAADATVRADNVAPGVAAETEKATQDEAKAVDAGAKPEAVPDAPELKDTPEPKT